MSEPVAVPTAEQVETLLHLLEHDHDLPTIAGKLRAALAERDALQNQQDIIDLQADEIGGLRAERDAAVRRAEEASAELQQTKERLERQYQIGDKDAATLIRKCGELRDVKAELQQTKAERDRFEIRAADNAREIDLLGERLRGRVAELEDCPGTLHKNPNRTSDGRVPHVYVRRMVARKLQDRSCGYCGAPATADEETPR